MTTRDSATDQAADDIVQRFIKERGDLFEEFHLFARESPDTVDLVRKTAGYVHFYENQTTPEQNLSGPMRELIATCQLCAKNDDRFAPNHVRRLYRMGVTNRVLFEAGEAIAPIVGWSTVAHIAKAIITANDPAYPYGDAARRRGAEDAHAVPGARAGPQSGDGARVRWPAGYAGMALYRRHRSRSLPGAPPLSSIIVCLPADRETSYSVRGRGS